jgi:pimeloyl-ACP methyl ester carboxylesterase
MLRGQFWPGNSTWVVLVHDVGENEDLDCWRLLLPSLLGRGWSVLAVDLRGHGASDGEWDAQHARTDLKAVLEYARENGATSISLAAVGHSGLEALAVSHDSSAAEALVLLAPVLDDEASASSFRGSGQAKHFICGGADPVQRRSAERLRNASIGWASILNLPTTEAGANLIVGAYGLHAREHIVGFLAEQEFIFNHRSVRRERPSAGST